MNFKEVRYPKKLMHSKFSNGLYKNAQFGLISF